MKKLSDIAKSLKELGKEGESVIKEEIQAMGLDVADRARQFAPDNFGKLRQSYRSNPSTDQLSAMIGSDLFYAAYMEFGTRGKVVVPSGYQEIAAKFKGGVGSSGGKQGFDDFMDAILQWVKSKGIADTYSIKTQKRAKRNDDAEERIKSAAFLIAMSILHNGVSPHPALIPAFIEKTRGLATILEKRFNELTRNV